MDKIEKFLRHLIKREELVLRQLLADIKTLNISNYDVRPLQGYKGVFRLRKGKIRIEFIKELSHGRILKVTYRKDAYRKR